MKVSCRGQPKETTVSKRTKMGLYQEIAIWQNPVQPCFSIQPYHKKKRRNLKMAANVETMFYTREKPWHGLGVKVADALSSAEALTASGLDWKVVQQEICTSDGLFVPGFKANVRDRDKKVLGIVSDRYKVVQNSEAFAFTDSF